MAKNKFFGMDGKGSTNIIWMGIVSFFTDVSSEMIFPVLPLFLTGVLNANMAVIGAIEGIAESTASLLKLFSGWLSDKMGKKKPLMFAGYVISALLKPMLALSTHWSHVLIVRVGDRIGKGIRASPTDALIASSVDGKSRGKYFGIHRAMDTSGAVVGSLLASLFLFLGMQYRTIFWISLFPGLIALAVIYFKVKDLRSAAQNMEKQGIKKGIKQSKKESKKQDIKQRRKESMKLASILRSFSPNYKIFLFVVTLFNLAAFSYVFFILRAKDVGMAIATVPIVYLVYNLFYAGFAMPAGSLSDKIGKREILAAGFVLYSITMLGFAYTATSISMWILFAMYGLFMAVTSGVARAYVADLADGKNLGTALGAYHTLMGITVLPANLIGGFLWASIGASAPFVYASLLSLLAAFLLSLLVKD